MDLSRHKPLTKKYTFESNYDAILIGSGMGCLSAGAILAKEGKKVLLLEQHYVAGGFTHIFNRRKYEWDVGLHYIGEVTRRRSVTKSLFNYITEGKLKWADMGEVYDRIVFGKKIYDYRKGRQNFINQMKEYFPDPKDQEAIEKYVALIRKAVSASQNFYAEKALPSLAAKLAGPFMKKKFYEFSDRKTIDVLRELTDNEELIGVLLGQWGDYGLPPSESSFVMQAAVAKHYLEGGAYPVGGSQNIYNYTAPVIRNAGGEILVKAKVNEILVEKGKAVGVELADGRQVFAPVVISGAGYHNTFKRLLNNQIKTEYGLEENASKVKASSSHVGLYIGLNKSSAELDLPKANFWIYPDNYDHDQNVKNFMDNPDNEFPVVYISFPSAKDPDFENRFPGRSTIEIITVAPYDYFKKWEDTKWRKRGDDYLELKEKYSQRMLEKLFEFVPQVKDHIDHYELSTPLSTKFFCEYDQGEIYGLEHTPDRFRHKDLRVSTPIKNLYMTGQDVVSAGVAGALASGLLTAIGITKKFNLMTKVLKS